MAVPDGKGKEDWSKLVLRDELFEYVLAKYGKDWKDDDAINAFTYCLIAYVQCIMLKVEAIVISSDDDDLSTDEEIVLMGDVLFSTTSNDDSDEEHVKKPQASSTSTLRGYRKIAITGCVKVANCALASRVVNAPYVDVGSSRTRRKEPFLFD
ncbi:hypothetical protein Tco_0451219 [Tanacetum coccineum]